MNGSQSTETGAMISYQQRVEVFVKASGPTLTHEDWQKIVVATGGDVMQALMLRISCVDNRGKLSFDRSFDDFVNHGKMNTSRGHMKKAVQALEKAHPLVGLGTEEGVYLAAAGYGSNKFNQKSAFAEPRSNHNPGADY